MRKLNLGCGTNIRDGWVNVDRACLPGIDLRYEAGGQLLPFRDGMFDEIVCDDILEHIPAFESVMRELHRILVPGGRLTIRVPHFSAAAAYTDPTHVRFFGVKSFDFFVKGHMRAYYYDFLFSRMEKRKITFIRGPYWYNTWLEFLVNSSRLAQERYDESFLHVFPAFNIEVVLVK